MTVIARTGAFIHASVSDLMNMMPARQSIRSLLFLAVFSVLFVVVLSELNWPHELKDDDRLPWESYNLRDDELRAQEGNQHSFADVSQDFQTPQSQYLEEAAKISSQFKHFVSTVKRIKEPKAPYFNPHVSDDPRAGTQTGPVKNQKIFRPYPDYQSEEWQRTHRGAFVPCYGARELLLNESLDDGVGVYVGIPDKFPEPIFGAHEVIGVDGQLSYDRYSRYSAYGFGQDEPTTDWLRPKGVDWDNVNWGALQQECVQRNAGRYNITATSESSGLAKWFGTDSKPSNLINPDIKADPRTAVLLRSYTDKEYSDNDKQVIRSMVTEWSLQSGGEYEVFLLVHVKDDGIPIHEKETYEQVLRDNVPQEFWNMTILWNMAMVSERYKTLDPGLLNVHQSQWFPIQHFMLEYPEFDFVWNWEIDARYTGHLYEFSEKVAEYGRNEPRRGMWERAERFYIPQIHGKYHSDYREYVANRSGGGVWGHMAYEMAESKLITPKGPQPPYPTPEQDPYEWGVGEDADFIGFLPIFNPINTDWVLRDDVTGYLGIDTPRRATIITHSRVSRRAIMAMDEENLNGRHVGSEMVPQTISLLHGFKSVFAPHPIWSDKPLSPQRMNRWFNSGVNGRSGNSKDSPFSWGREQRFKDLSWYYRCNLPGRLYWNYLGWEKDSTGGKNYEHIYGRVVLPPMLFHPIKDALPDSDSMNYDLPT